MCMDFYSSWNAIAIESANLHERIGKMRRSVANHEAGVGFSGFPPVSAGADADRLRESRPPGAR